MSHDATDLVPTPRPGGGLFASGVVLGVALGIAGGHLLVFANHRTSDTAASAEEEFAQVVASAPRFAASLATLPPEDSACSILEFDGREDVGRVKLSDVSSSDDDHLHFFPEAMNAPGSDAVTHADRHPAKGSPEGNRLQMTADVKPPREEPPQALQPPLAAAPIDQATSDRQALARAIIQQELPGATPQEREVWCEVLQGLPAEDIKGILRMRKHIGDRDSLAFCAPLPLPTPLTGLPARGADSHSPPPASQEQSVAGRRLGEIARHNLANRSTVAFKQQVPVLVESAADDAAGIGISRVIRDMRQGEMESTGRSLDIAIDGPGFLTVRRDDEVRYTRDGRLTLDEQRRLKLLGPAENWLIDPPVTVPEEAIDLVISETGEVGVVLPDESQTELGTLRIVRFLDPSALEDGHEGLYRATTASGAPHESPPLVLQGHLERSNAVVPAAQACFLGSPTTARH